MLKNNKTVLRTKELVTTAGTDNIFIFNIELNNKKKGRLFSLSLSLSRGYDSHPMDSPPSCSPSTSPSPLQ